MNEKNKIKAGLVGLGHLGAIHLKLLGGIKECELVGVYDSDQEKAERLAHAAGVPAYQSFDALLGDCEAIDIVTPTTSHFAYAHQALEAGRHVFIEKPIAETPPQAALLSKLAQTKGLVGQVGHVERFNPAFAAAGEQATNPMFIEAHRLAEFKPRGIEVSVVLDLMIHDLDIVLHLVQSPVERVSASGVAVLSDSIDIANARIEFENGAVANLTASRVSLKNERKMRLFKPNSYVTIDFAKRETHLFSLRDLGENEAPTSEIVYSPGDGKARKELHYKAPKPEDINAIEHELGLWFRSILRGEKSAVPLDEGERALALAHHILSVIDERNLRMKKGK